MRELIVAVIAVFLAGSALGKDYGVFVDGAFGKKQDEMNKLVKDRVDAAKKAFDKRPGSESHKATSKDQLCTALESIKCGEGDTITLFFMGHGKKNTFVFSLASGSKRKISATELKNKIVESIEHCTCEVRVVIFSCHSGSFLDELFMDEHIKAVYASCRAGQKSYSDAFFSKDGFQSKGDWAEQFIKKWDSLPPTQPLGSTLEEANRCANDKAPAEFAKLQRPTAWRRGTFPVKAHVEPKLKPNSRSFKVTFYDPAYLRGKKVEIKVDRKNGKPAQEFPRCSWITFQCKFGDPATDKGCPEKPPVMVTPPVASTAPEIKYVAHVNKNPDKKDPRVVTTILEPWWLACRKRIVETQPGGSRATDVKACSFIRGDGTVLDPRRKIGVTGKLERFNYCPEIVAKVEKVVKSKNKVCVWIKRPLSMTFLTTKKVVCIELPPGKREILKKLKPGHFIRCKIKTNALGRQLYAGSDMIRVASSEAGLTSFDLGLAGMVDPVEIWPTPIPMTPRVEIGNYGAESYFEGAGVRVRIHDGADEVVYEESLPAELIDPEQSKILIFPEWLPPESGNYRMRVDLLLAGFPDEDPLNDFFDYPFQAAPDVEPEGWAGQFLGLPLPMGFEAVERMVVAPGVGSGVGGNFDQLGFVHQPIDGDFFVSGFLPLEELQEGATLGFMARHDLGEDAPMVSFMAAANQFVMAVRGAPGGNANPVFQEGLGQPGIWLGLEREGDEFLIYESEDGQGWNELARQTLVDWPETLIVGVASSSGMGQGMPPSEVPMLGIGGFPAGLEDGEIFEEFEAFPFSNSEVELQWPDLVSTEFGYAVYRAEDGLNFEQVANLPPDSTFYLDSGLAASKLYHYEVRPIFVSGEIEPPTFVTAETQGAGLEAWSLGNDIIDPTRIPPWGGEPWMFHYFTGQSPFGVLRASDLMKPQILDGEAVIVLTKAPGVFDLKLEIEIYDVANNEWEVRHVIPAEAQAGDYPFQMSPHEAGRLIYRVKVSPP